MGKAPKIAVEIGPGIDLRIFLGDGQIKHAGKMMMDLNASGDPMRFHGFTGYTKTTERGQFVDKSDNSKIRFIYFL